MCSGTGACAFWEIGTACGSSCEGSSRTNRTCNGLGTCQATSVTQCDPYQCANAASCKSTCSSDTDCVSGAYCHASTQTCQLDNVNGVSCTSASQCQSGHCIDSVCCNDACDGTCSACTALKKGSGSDGVCGGVALGSDPDEECATQSASTCGTLGTCGIGGCQLYPPGYECGTPACSSGTRTAFTCNGAGTCSSTSDACSPYACNGTDCFTSCSGDAACLAASWCDLSSGTCQPDLTVGGACVRASQCNSGNCVDGYCCDTACTGPCMACSATVKGDSSANGVCGPIKKATDPQNECATQTSSTCGTTGTCSGSGSCEQYPAGTQCQSSTCSESNQARYECNGFGTCGSITVPCSPYTCAGSSCATSCTTNAACITSYYCNTTTNTCQPDQALGAACSSSSQCAGGNCVDGFCCDTACTGPCMACSAAIKGDSTANGVCGPIKSATDPQNECATQASSTCGTTGTCSGFGSCQLYGQGTACGSTTCVSGWQTGQACDGSGNCIDATSTACSPYLCGGSACGTACTTDAACITSYYCNTTTNTCQPDQALGAACSSSSQCAGGNCVDGFCCDTACTGPCMACSATIKGDSTANGVCGPIKTATDPQNECTTQTSSTCGTTGTCSGFGSCQLYGQGTACGSTTCVSGWQTGQACDGSGNCIDATSTACSPYVCGGSACGTACTTDAACITNYYCNTTTNTCQPDQTLGAACSSSSQCASGNCVDGFCCDTACEGACMACSAAIKGDSTANGVCGPIQKATDPQNECTTQTSSTCGTTGTCSGFGSCQLYGQGTACGSTTCVSGWQTGQACDGWGNCIDATSTACSPYMCGGSACGTACATDAGCIASYYCDTVAGICKADQTNGSSCTNNSQCASGSCADGVCCDTACAGTCQACTTAKKGGGSDGVCGNVVKGLDPDIECDDQQASSCGTNGSCSGNGTCDYYGAGTPCGSTTCSNDMQTGYACNGLGTCLPSTSTPCSPYLCGGNSCGNSCSTDSDCISSYWCNPSVLRCELDKGNGGSCTSNSQCASGNCVDGVCCDTACQGTCSACTAAKKGKGADGTCGNIVIGDDPDDECFNEGADSCGSNGSCNGMGACSYYSSGTPCGATTCSNDTQTGQACNGSGTCLPSSSTNCAPYKCSGNACGSACMDDSGCASSYWCDLTEQTCKPDQAVGASCTAASQCSSGLCVDGFCCDTACDSVCMACSAQKKGSGADGSCGAILTNRDPDNECTQTAASTCGSNGYCDGKGACAMWGAGTACGSTSCTGGTQVGRACDGSGTCAEAQTSLCAPYYCMGSACAMSCVDNSGCIDSYYCEQTTGFCEPDKNNGGACTLASECKSGYCVDGFCCDTGCQQNCYACSADKKGQGSDGICGPIAANIDPDNECSDAGQTSCLNNGFCDGNGECSVYAAGAACGETTCGNGVQSGKACNGLGTCVSSSSTDCSPFVCKGDACATSCNTDSDCVGTFYCQLSDHTCQPDQSLGGSCTQGSQCQSGNCADGVCCDTACTGLCQACTSAKKGSGGNGECGNVEAGNDFDGDCDAASPGSCGLDGFCDGAGECRLFGHGVSCGASSCQGNVAKGEICNGLGSCIADSGGADCSPYVCDGFGCATPCATDSHCISGHFCDQGECKSKGDIGLACTSGEACASGICMDGYCCDNECTGQCEACNLAGAEGICAPVTGAPQGSRPACGGQGDCAGICDGANPSQCSFPGSAVVCEQSCTNGALAIGSCNGLGLCQSQPASSCAPYGCSSDGTSCNTTCDNSTDCASGAECTPEGQCQSGSGGSAGSDSGTAGAGGSGGNSSGSGGADAGEAPLPVAAAPAPEPSGCGCRSASRGASGASYGALLLLGVLVLRRRATAVRKAC